MSKKELTPVLLPPLVAFTGYTNSTTLMEAVGRLDDTTSDTLGDELASLIKKTLDKGISPNFSDTILNSLVDGTLSYPGLIFFAIIGLRHEWNRLIKEAFKDNPVLKKLTELLDKQEDN